MPAPKSTSSNLLRKVLGQFRFAYEHSKFYSRKFRETGLDKESITSFDDFWKRVPLTTSEEIIGNPEWKRGCEDSTAQDGPLTILQLESKNYDSPMFVCLTGSTLRSYAKALARCWKSWGVRRHDVVEICDFGNSPAAYLASRYFVPHLVQGASEILGALAACNDGLPEFVTRGIYMAEVMRPRVIVMREDLLPLLASSLRTSGSASHTLSGLGVERLVVTSNDSRNSGQHPHFGVDTYRLLRCDHALFIASDCSMHEGFHLMDNLYFADIVDPESGEQIPSGIGRVAITNLFARSTMAVRFLTKISGSLESQIHGCGQSGPRIILEKG